MNSDKKPLLGLPYLNVSHDGCVTVSHTDSCVPRWNVLMNDGFVVPSPHLPNPYVLSTSMIQCIAYIDFVPYVEASSLYNGS